MAAYEPGARVRVRNDSVLHGHYHGLTFMVLRIRIALESFDLLDVELLPSDHPYGTYLESLMPEGQKFQTTLFSDALERVEESDGHSVG